MNSNISKLFFNLKNFKTEVNKLYKLYNKSQFWSNSRMKEYQLDLMQKLWFHSVQNVNFYKKFSKNNKLKK